MRFYCDFPLSHPAFNSSKSRGRNSLCVFDPPVSLTQTTQHLQKFVDDPSPTIHEPKAHKIVEPAKVIDPKQQKKENRQEGAPGNINNTNHNKQKFHRQFV